MPFTNGLSPESVNKDLFLACCFEIGKRLGLGDFRQIAAGFQ